MVWAVRRSTPGEGEIFRTRRDRSRGPPSFLYNGCLVSFPGVKRPGRDGNHPPPSSAEVTAYCCAFTPPLGLHDLLYGEHFPLPFFLPHLSVYGVICECCREEALGAGVKIMRM
jgi:hypothetical protein